MGEDDIKLEPGKLYFKGEEIAIKPLEIKAVPGDVKTKLVNGITTMFVILNKVVIKIWNYFKVIFRVIKKSLEERGCYNNKRKSKRRWQQIYKAIRLSYK